MFRGKIGILRPRRHHQAEMRIYAVVLAIVSGLYVFDYAQSKSNLHHCGRHRFFNETSTQCESCDLCGPGTYVKSKCKGSRDTTCRNCPSGYFSISYSRSPNLCRRCSDCGMREVTSPCTSKSDAKCGECPLGTYWNYVKYVCTPCSYCFPEYAEYMAIEPSCENPQIPSTHRCAEASWAPYKPPPLILRVNEDGDATFTSSKDVETSRFIGAVAKASRTMSTKVGSTVTASALSHPSSTEDLNASIDEVISKFTKLYNVHCSRTLLFAGLFCVCVLFTAVIAICVILKKRQYSQFDRKEPL